MPQVTNETTPVYPCYGVLARGVDSLCGGLPRYSHASATRPQSSAETMSVGYFIRISSESAAPSSEGESSRSAPPPSDLTCTRSSFAAPRLVLNPIKVTKLGLAPQTSRFRSGTDLPTPPSRETRTRALPLSCASPMFGESHVIFNHGSTVDSLSNRTVSRPDSALHRH